MPETPACDSFPAVHAPVTDLMLYLTEDCNLRCSYCFVTKSPRRMSSDTARKAVEFFLDRNISGAEHSINITFFGGEPFLELDRMEEVIALGRQHRPNVYKQMTFAATTNGTICSDRVERIVRESNMSVLFSLDGGPDASQHRPLQCGRSSWDLVARNLPLLAAWSPDLTVRMSFHPGALDLVGNVRHALELGAPAVSLCPVTDADWKGHEERLEAAFEDLAAWYVDEARQDRLPPLTVTNDTIRHWHHVRQGGKRVPRPCRVATSVLGVDPDGHVMPCHRFLYRPGDHLGTVETSLLSQDRWKYVHLSAGDVPGCEDCLASPVCGGGCRAVVLQAGLDLRQAHPSHCLITRAHTRAAISIYETLSQERNRAFLSLLTSSSARKVTRNAPASLATHQGG